MFCSSRFQCVVSACLVFAFVGVVFGAAPAVADDTLADSLSSKVLIRRDTFGVPHILADTEAAATFGYGYAAAEDHVLGIARLILKGKGEEAKYFGKAFAESDLLVKRLRNYTLTQGGYEEMAPWLRHIVDGYALGYSRYVEQHRSELPDWVQAIDAVDVLAHARRVIAIEFCMDLRQIARIGKKDVAQAEEETLRGSNTWAVNKDRSESGNALLLGNPHLRWSGSHTWHEAHLTVPGRLNFMGGTLIGVPFPALGWNDHLGWSHTVNPHDCDDVWELQLDPENPNAYLYDGQSVPFDRETIRVEIKTDGGMEEKTEEVLWTHYGPVVKRIDDKVYAYRSASLTETRMFEQWYRMTKARNLAEFRAALDLNALPMFNIAYADDEGNCFYIFNGRFPDRPTGYDWSGVVPGGTSATEWLGILPQARLPQLLNPPTGYVQNSNSAPWYTNLDSIIDRRKFPAELIPNTNSLRTQHGLMLLEQNPSITFDEILRDKYSMRLLAADRVKGDLLNIARLAGASDADLAAAVEVLSAWDNTASRESRGSNLFSTFWRRYTTKAKPVYEVAWTERHPASTPHGIGDAGEALDSLRWAVGRVRKEFGALDAPWGDSHRLRLGDVDVPIGGQTGDYGAFRVVGYAKAEDGKYVAAGGDSYVFVVEFSDPVKTRSILAYSESGSPESPHYNDQSPIFAANGWKPTFFDEDELARNTERVYRP